MKILSMLIFILSLTFMVTSHPIALMAIILTQTTTCCIMLVTMNLTSWFSFILFLIFLGGLMVLFIYISSLASNEKFFLETTKMIYLMVIFTGSVTLFGVFMNNQVSLMSYASENKILTNMYTSEIALSTSATMLYLLLTLIVVVKMTSKYEGPLRNIIFKQ